ncbi:MAG: thioredoxin [Oscillospiraceae bacterium]
MVTKVTSQNFEQEVLKSDKPVLVDFWASWCGPCMMMSPIVDELAEEETSVKFCKVNVDEEQQLAMKFGIESIPSMLLFENGRLKDKIVGAVPKAQLKSFITKA